jgi:hypothetical protein
MNKTTMVALAIFAFAGVPIISTANASTRTALPGIDAERCMMGFGLPAEMVACWDLPSFPLGTTPERMPMASGAFR